MTANVRIQQILLKRGPTANVNAYTGPLGELVIDTEAQNLRIQDGVTPGGWQVTGGGSGIDSTLRANVGSFYTWANANFGTSTYSNTNIAAYLVANPQSGVYSNANVYSFNSNIYSGMAAANSAIVTANTALKSYVDARDSAITTAWTANAVIQDSKISGANAAIVTANTAMKSYVDAQASAITSAWTANAATQASSITSNYNTLIANLTFAHSEIDGLRANITASNVSIASLQSNASTQQTQINAINANVAAANAAIAAIQTGSGFATVGQLAANIASVTANAVTQETEINALRANITAANSAIATLQTQTYTNTNAAAYLAGNVTIGNLTVSQDAVILGNMRVQGTQTTVNAATLVVNDLWVTVANGAAQASDANGAGIRVAGALANIAYSSVSDSFEFNKPITVANIKSESWEWTFNDQYASFDLAAGGIRFADSSIQTTAWTGPPSNISNGLSSVDIPVSDGNVIVDANGFQWQFDSVGNITFPDNTKFSGNTTFLPNSQGASWKFYEPMVGSDTVKLYMNELTTGWATWALTTGNGANSWYFDSEAQEFSLFNGGAGGKLVFGTAANASVGSSIDDIELKSTTGNVYITANSNPWTFSETGNLVLPTNWNFTTSPAISGTGIIFGDGSYQYTAWTGVPSNRLVNDVYTATLDATGDLSVPGNIIPTTDNIQDLGSATNRFRHLYVGPGTVYVGNAAIKTTATGNLILPGLTRAVASSAYAEEVDDRGDQTQTFTTVPTVIDNATYQRLNGGPVTGFTAAEYSVDQLDGEGYIDGISIDSQGSGYADTVAELAQENMWATEAADPINNFDPNDWIQIPFQVRSRAGESEYEFSTGGGNADLGELSIDNSMLQSGETDNFINLNDNGGVRISTVSDVALNITVNSGGDNNNDPQTWEFGTDGTLNLPDGGEIWFNYGYIDQDENRDGNALRVSGGNVVVIHTAEDNRRWLFNNDGNLSLPLGGYILNNDGTIYSGGNIVSTSAPVIVGSSAEGSEGALWYNTTDGRLYVDVNNNGTTTWVDANPSVIPGNMVAWENDSIEFPDGSIQDTASGIYAGNTAPTAGFAWYNTEDGRTYNNVNGVWVDANPSVIPGDIVTYNADGNIALGVGGQLTWANGVSILRGIDSTSDRIRSGSQIFKVQDNGSVMFPDGSTQDTAYTGLPTDIAAYIIAGDGTSYNVPGALRAVQNDANWAFGFAHPGGEEYYTRTTFWGASYNIRGFQVYDNSINASRFTVTGTGNVVIGSGGQIVFADGTTLSTAPTAGSTYGDSNVASYLSAHPPTGTYSDSNVASYLSSGNYATTTDISTAINSLIGSAPGTLDTLQEIAANLATEAGAIGSITNSIANTNANIVAANLAIATLQTQIYTDANVASYLPTYSGNIAGLTLTSQFRLFGSVPSSLTGSSGDLAGAVRVDNNYIYYCTADYADQHYTTIAGSQYVDSTYYIHKGSYPQPEPGWLFTSLRYGADQVITGVVDGGPLGWGIQVSGVIQNNGMVNQDNNIGLFNPTYPTIWKQIPWTATDYSNVNVAAYLSSENITSANIGGSQVYANARITALESNIGSYYTWANANAAGLSSSITGANSVISELQANIGGSQTYANSRVGALESNIGSYYTWANANAAGLSSSITGANSVISELQANIGSFYTYANATYTGGVGSTYSNANVASYLPTYSGNIGAANIVTTGATSGNISGANYISANAFQVSNGIFWANGTAWSSSSGGGTNYTNANVSTFLASFGSNSISTTGNITAGNIIANQFGNSVGTTATYSGNVTALNIITTGTYGNITNANVISANNVVVSGYGVTMANRPAFRIYGGAPSWFNTSNVNLKGSSIVVDYNQGNYFNSTTGIFTAPVAGLYQVTLNARVGSNNGQNQMVVGKNGVATAGNVAVMWESDTNAGTAIHYGVVSTIRLAANDWLSANITVGNIQFDQNDSWTVTYIG